MSLTNFEGKVAELLALEKAIEYVQTPMSRRSDWRHSDHQGIYHKAKRFFKVLTVVGRWMQPIVCQESQQYDKHTCDKFVGLVRAPLVFLDGSWHVGLTATCPAGSYGAPTPTFPRASLSNSDQLPEAKVLYEFSARLDPARLTGRALCQVVRPKNGVLDPRCAYFDVTNELVALVTRGILEDGASLALANHLLWHWRTLRSILVPDDSPIDAAA